MCQHIIFRKFLFLSSLLIALPVFLFGQSDRKIEDTLKKVLSSNQSDTDKVSKLIDLTAKLDCNDTIAKLYYLNEAKIISEKSASANGLVKYYLAQAAMYFHCLGMTGKAVQYALSADSICTAANCDLTTQRNTLNSVAFYYKRLGKYTKAIDYYERMLALNKDPDERIGILANLGVSYNNIGDYNKAINAYFNSLKVLDEVQSTKKRGDNIDSIQRAGLLSNISDIYLSMSLPDKALTFFDSVYKIGVSLKNSRVEVLALLGKGKSFQVKGDLDKAIEQYLLGLQKCKEVYEPEDQVKILYELTICYLNKGDLSSATHYAQDALKIAEQHSYENLLSRVYIALGKVCLQQKEYSNAINYLQQALAISNKGGKAEDERDAWAALSDAYEITNDPAKALDAYRHYIGARDSIYNISKANEFARQELDYMYKNRELADKMAYDKQLARQQVFIYAGSAVVLLLILVSFFAYRNYQTQKKYNELLSREKEGHLQHIQAQDTVLTDIAHIQSHKVRGPIATILGLAQLFNHDDPADPINKEVITSVTDVTNRLDVVVKEVVEMENRLRSKSQNNDKASDKTTNS